MSLVRFLAVLLAILLLFGCVTQKDITGEDNGTPNQPPGTPSVQINNSSNSSSQPIVPTSVEWETMQVPEFSFSYPKKMMNTVSYPGLILVRSNLPNGEVAELISIVYFNTSTISGANMDQIFKGTPSETAANFLVADQQTDPAGILQMTTYRGNITTYTIVRDAYIAEMSFLIKFFRAKQEYYGYALDIYVPERSLHLKVRIVATDKATANSIKDKFLVSFRV